MYVICKLTTFWKPEADFSISTPVSEASSESPAPRIGVYLNEFFIFVDGVVLCKVFELPQALFLMFSSFYFEYPNQVKNVMHAVGKKTVQKWITENDRNLNTSVWLDFELCGRDTVSVLKCSVCREFRERLISMKNFRPAFIDGTSNCIIV